MTANTIAGSTYRRVVTSALPTSDVTGAPGSYPVPGVPSPTPPYASPQSSVVRDVCDRVAVMYLGEIVERGPTEAVFADPQHPYTRALLASMPTPDPARRGERADLSGEVPDPGDPPSGCRFHTRCPAVIQPDEYDLNQAVWRAVFALRIAVRDRTLEPDRLRERLVAEGSAASTNEVSATQLRDAIRSAYDLPDELDDPDAEAVLADALPPIVDGDLAAAEDVLAPFASVCEREHSALRETNVGHQAACHLHAVGDRDAPDEGRSVLAED